MPPDPLEPFLFRNQLQINSTEKKCPWKQNKHYGHHILKFLATPLITTIIFISLKKKPP